MIGALCSPVEISASYSRPPACGSTSFASLMSRSVSPDIADTTTTSSSVTSTSATETQVQFKPKIDATFGKLAAAGKQLLGSLGIEYSKKWTETVASQNTEQLSQLRSASSITTVTHSLGFTIPPTPAGRTVSLYICPVYRLHSVEAVDFDGPDAYGQATARTALPGKDAGLPGS